MQKIIAIVTGATGGVGKEFVHQLLNEDLDEIWCIARNNQKLNQLKKDFGMKIRALPCDLSEMNGLRTIEKLLSEEKPLIKYIVNNAGIAKMAKYDDFSLDEIDKTINLNCKTPIIMCRLCIPFMKSGSRILNISSASAFQPNPYINLYASSKVFERHYSRALNIELKGTGITSTAVCPSWVDTDMLTKEINGRKVKFPGMVTADKVVKQALKDAKRGRDMSVCSLYVKCQHLNVKLFPQKLVMKLWMRGIRDYL